MKVAVLSSVYGGYDQPLPPPVQSMDCHWIMVSDQVYPELQGWDVVVEPRPQLHPRLAAKVAKCRPDLYADADIYIWVDGSFALKSHEFVDWAVGVIGDGQLAQIPHPRRHIEDEADVSSELTKYAGLPIREQVHHYRMSGYPDGWGLWCTGLIVYRNGDWLRSFGDAWLREQMRWTYQDQLSEAPVLHSLGIRPVDIALDLINNPFFDIRWQGGA